MKQNHLTFKILALIVLNDLGDTIANTLMKKGMAIAGVVPSDAASFAHFVASNIASPLLWLGILVYAFNFFVWITILYKVDLSIAMPLGSFSYIMIPFSAIFFLHEHVSPVRWIGILCIVLGIHFVAQSPKVSGWKGGAHA